MLQTNTDTPLYLALDQGGHASRALVFDGEGHIVAHDEQPLATHHPQSDWVEHDPEQLLASLRCAAARAIATLGDSARYLRAAGLATQRSSVVCWRRDSGSALSPVISWQDRRAAAWLAGFAPHESDVHARTGLRLSPHYGASKLRWCLDHLPAVQHAQQAGNLVCGPLASFLIQSLVAQRPAYADPANASRSLLWNLDTGQWDPVLLARFGIPATILPQCVPSRFAFGELLLDAPQALPLRVVTGDQSAAAFGAGIPPADIVQVNVGTGAFLQHISPQPRRHDRLLTSVVHREPSRALYALEGTVNGAGSALSWFAQQEALTDWQARAAHWLGTREPIPLFINGIGGIGSPYWAPHVASRFVGEGTQAGRFCAVVESIAFLIVENLHAFRDAGILPRELWLSGGLGQLTGLCHRLADLAGIAVRRSTVTEATGRGLAQWLSDFSLPRLSEGELFIPRSNPELLARYHRWHQAMSGACAAAPAAKL